MRAQKKIRAGTCEHAAHIIGTTLFHQPIEWSGSFTITAAPRESFFERESGVREK